MALDDFRRWLDVGARDGSKGSLGLEAAATRDVLALAAMAPDGTVVELELDYSDASLLLDWLREGLAVLLARHGNPVAAAAIVALKRARDTPNTGASE